MRGNYSCVIVDKEKLTDTAFAIMVRCAEIAGEARAGQFVNIKCGDERLLRRPISICSTDGDIVKIVFEVRGEGTAWLSRCKMGQTLDILGPLGNGFNLPDGNIIIVGGGIGVPPLLLAAKSAKRKVIAVLGFRSLSRIMLKEEFDATCGKVYITTDDGSFGINGPVTVPLEEILKKGGHSAVLACGPRPMLSAVAQLCSEYTAPCQVSLEERMACGIGACLVCACKTVKNGEEYMSRVCKDGPVFYAEEVDW